MLNNMRMYSVIDVVMRGHGEGRSIIYERCFIIRSTAPYLFPSASCKPSKSNTMVSAS